MFPINNLNLVVAEEEERLENIRVENIERRIMRVEADCFTIEDVRFKELFRLTKDMAQFILNGITPLLIQGNNPVAIAPITKFFAALHFYATGTYQRVIGQSYNVSMAQQSVSRAIEEVTEAIINTYAADWIQFPVTPERKNTIRNRFMEAKHFPGVIGVIDGTHVEIIRPTIEEHAFLNRKGYHSKNVQIICDFDLRILNINARHGGASHDSHIWRTSSIRQEMERAHANGDRHSWLLGDSGYPQEPWLMTPLLNAPPDSPEFRYTQCHIQARNCVERCIGVLKSRFLCLSKILRYSSTKVGNICNTCAILHNICTEGRLNDELEIPPPPADRRDDMNIPYVAHVGNVAREGIQARQGIINQYFQ